MDIRDIKELAVRLRATLRERGIRSDAIILFGSYAVGRQSSESDIDLAVVSRDFGHDRIAEGSLLNVLATRIERRIEAIPIGLTEYLEPMSISPILHEIKANGTNLL